MQDTDRHPGSAVEDAAARTRSASDRLTQHETLLLYGVMASRCAKCKTLVVRESGTSGKAFNLGKRAHVVGRSEAGPRGSAEVSARDRGDVRNHLLLCGTCHDEIDRDLEGWPVGRLERLRDEHLSWVAARLGEAPVDQGRLVYANAVDTACELVWLDSWAAWTRYMLHPSLSWSPTQVDAVGEFVRHMSATDWPGELPEVEVALTRLAYLLGEAASTFADRAESRDPGDLHVYRRYKQGWNPHFQRDQEAFTEWLEYYEGLVFEATKAANWVRSAWRAAGNAEFLPGERICLVTGPHDDLRDHINVPRYTEEEKRRLLDVGREEVGSVPTLRLDFQSNQSGLGPVLRDVLLDVLERDPAPDMVGALATRLHELEGVTDTAALFEGLPGRAPKSEDMKRVTYALLEEGILQRNPEGRGFVRGDLPT